MLKFLSYEKLAMTSQFDLTDFMTSLPVNRFFNSVFNSRITDRDVELLNNYISIGLT